MRAVSVADGSRNSVVLLVFTAVTNLADGITKIALPLLATRLTSSPLAVSAVSLALTLPWLLTALHIGALVDRADRRRLLWLADGVRLLAVGVLGVLTAAGRGGITALVLAALALGVAEVVALTSAAALVPALVPRDRRARVNAWIAGAETAANEFGGPFLGGLLFAAGAAVALGAAWTAYLGATCLLLLLVGRFRAVPRHVPGGAPGVHGQIGEGLRHLWRHPLLRVMSLTLTVLCAGWGAWTALMPLVATGRMGLSAREYGVVVSALGCGGLAGAFAAGAVNRLLGRRRALLADLVTTFAMLAVPALTSSLWAVAAAAFLGGAGGTLWTVNARLIGQNLVPEDMAGRYNGAYRLLSWGAMPVGAGLVGVLAQWLGDRVAFLFFAGGVLATVPVFWRTVTVEAVREAT
ncbi:MFS transporter [Streptomyces caatingaensis]|uniref:Transporter n=1 Tax=Streptomyces caatingaensis TaxID=1678637 RepID=A0A0K9XC39_9ACTN|nr:MFS transporter [Streptomyces caatingaensis]KNB50763.1 transporter [Streptomyces caatingaensis]